MAGFWNVTLSIRYLLFHNFNLTDKFRLCFESQGSISYWLDNYSFVYLNM